MNTKSKKNSQDSHVSTGPAPAPADEAVARVPNGTSAGHPAPRAGVAADRPSHPEKKDEEDTAPLHPSSFILHPS
jgi:hypothetical protein